MTTETASMPVATTSGNNRPLAGADRLLVFGLATLLIFGPLSFGAVQEWSIFVLVAGSSVLWVLWITKQILAGRLQLHTNGLFAPALAFGSVVAAQILLGLSAYPYATYSEGVKLVCYGILFFLATQYFKSENELKGILIGAAVFGFLLAVFAVVQDLTWNGRIYWVKELRSGALSFGPYVNRNHYAGLMEMLTPFPLVLCLRRSLPGAQRGLAAFVAIVMAGSIFMSGSRGGMFAFVFQVLVLGAWILTRRRGPKMALQLTGIFVLTGVFLWWLGVDRMVDRLATLQDTANEQASGYRLRIVKDSFSMFAERPLTGWGLGVFPVAYPQFRSFYTNKFVNQAHNDYMQTLVETGLLGFAAMLWFLFQLYRTSLRRLRLARTGIGSSVALAALLGCTGILVHSFYDFNLHIPGNAAWFFVLCALAVSAGELDSQSAERQS